MLLIFDLVDVFMVKISKVSGIFNGVDRKVDDVCGGKIAAIND